MVDRYVRTADAWRDNASTQASMGSWRSPESPAGATHARGAGHADRARATRL